MIVVNEKTRWKATVTATLDGQPALSDEKLVIELKDDHTRHVVGVGRVDENNTMKTVLDLRGLSPGHYALTIRKEGGRVIYPAPDDTTHFIISD